ncbi:hypothetical protein FA95DRAFT_1565669 [Auriscalpium vulgare]|uniref:Uncharacterized protein n=1 Tax=Auriscalpium vulgare TaxID=40419 RepID=A0ACB8RBY0_9AGAM|nr:hypothetical protein FA95DRAFT_1565669 [Auriscalpium vulgare]
MLAAQASLEIIELSDSTQAAQSSNDRSEPRRMKDEAAKLRADAARLKQENARKGKGRMLAAQASLEIIELLDSTQSSAAQSSNDRSELRRMKDEAAKLRADVARLKQENARIQDLLENEHLRSQKKLQTANVPVALLEDVVLCEICTAKMWTPFLMPDCGHTFCETCIDDWFTTIRTKHLATNPHLSEQILLTLPPAERPAYTCPACRTAVRTFPVECFTLKSVVRIVADAVGESSPPKSAPGVKQGGIWGGFFGAN